MPGFILEGRCPCEFSSVVHPGSRGFDQLSVIAYDDTKSGLVTVDSREAEAQGLRPISDPYLEHSHRPMGDPEVQALRETATFECPACHQISMRFGFSGFWD